MTKLSDDDGGELSYGMKMSMLVVLLWLYGPAEGIDDAGCHRSFTKARCATACLQCTFMSLRCDHSRSLGLACMQLSSGREVSTCSVADTLPADRSSDRSCQAATMRVARSHRPLSMLQPYLTLHCHSLIIGLSGVVLWFD